RVAGDDVELACRRRVELIGLEREFARRLNAADLPLPAGARRYNAGQTNVALTEESRVRKAAEIRARDLQELAAVEGDRGARVQERVRHAERARHEIRDRSRGAGVQRDDVSAQRGIAIRAADEHWRGHVQAVEQV